MYAIRSYYAFIPEEIKELTNLKILDIRVNLINTLPESITTLHHLEKLYLGQNSFQEIPESIKKCPSLVSIDFTENEIKT